GSMAGDPINQARNAMRDFVQTLEPADNIGIISFSAGVSYVQPFTTDRNLLSAAIGNLQAVGDTALYDAVLRASSEISNAPTGRRLVVLLSDGKATTSLDQRQASIAAAAAADAGVVTLGLGADLDTQYLTDVANVTGGRYLPAPTPASLRQAYTDLAYTIRSQYTLVLDMPPSVDRTVPGTLRVHATVNADNSFTERALAPLAGALPPPFDMSLTGLEPGQKLNQPVTLQPSAHNGIKLAKVEYLVDGQSVYTATGDAPGYDFDVASFAPGNHVLTVEATDDQGKPGRVDIPFIVTPPPAASSGGASLPIIPIIAALAVGVIAWMLFKLIKKRRDAEPVLVPDRDDTWKKRGERKSKQSKDAQDEDEASEPRRRPAPARPRVVRAVARIVVMNEEAVRSGQLDAIQEYEMYATPLTFGTGATANVRVIDPSGMIAAEEARIWVQRGRMVYHKLTTLSAMATEGVTAGWHFLDNGEEMRIGDYRIVFQVIEDDAAEDTRANLPRGLPQEHGMSLHRSAARPDDQVSLEQFTDASLEEESAADPLNREDEQPYDSTPFRSEGDYRSA
ncbi:MAG TPA: VWA domain-containing protein, partial [Dehalococcoidia bacterium]|nr:VWA domain-containing protein [Dehalococcoidia bacterium]